MKKLLFTFVFTIVSACCFFIFPQVSIGSLNPPAAGSLLDLNSGGNPDAVRGGLVLSNVALRDTLEIPDVPGPFHLVNQRQNNPELAGMLVYNTTADPCEGLMPGAYVWDGTEWIQLSGEEPVCPYKPDDSGNYALKGKICYDVNQTESYNCGATSTRPNDFDVTKTYRYVFEHAGILFYSNLTFHVSDPNKLIARYWQNDDTCFVRFADNIAAKATGHNRDNPLTARIIARYTDYAGNLKSDALTIRVQDCACGCSVKSLLPQKWLTFMCYNLGVSEYGKSLTVPQQLSYIDNYPQSLETAIYGYLYQWGRREDGHQFRDAQNMTGPCKGPFDYNGQIPPYSNFYGKNVIAAQKPFDWRDPHTSNLWDGTTPTSDPCPDGWRVPTIQEMQSIVNGDEISIKNKRDFRAKSDNIFEWSNGKVRGGASGWKISPDEGANFSLFFPDAGHRTYLGGVESRRDGAYWTRSFKVGVNPYYVHFEPMSLHPGNTQNRAYACSVRCVSE
jgi:uncharacterized protein (TIGR02145 family)